MNNAQQKIELSHLPFALQRNEEGNPTIASDRWVEACWEEMRLRCEAGVTFNAGNYLAMLDSPSEDVAVDLIYGEYVTRIQAGEEVDTEELILQHPAYSQAITRQLSIEGAIGGLHVDEFGEEEDRSLLPFDHIDRYRLIARLGTGGQAVVFRAHDPELRRDVVVKLQKENATDGANRFAAAEAVIGANLDHPALAPVIDAGQIDGRRYLVSRYIDAMTFSQWIRIRRPSHAKIASVVSQISDAVSYAHKRGVLHLDIKPANVLIDAGDNPYIIDFGLASANRADESLGNTTDTIRGTLAFMSPEQAKGESSLLSSATDVYGVGALLYLAICGCPPYQNISLADLAEVQAGEWDAQRLAASPSTPRIRKFIERAMAVDPADRFQDAQEMAVKLREIAQPRFTGRRTFIWGLAGTLAIAFLGGLWMRPAIGPSPSRVNQPLSVLLQGSGDQFSTLGDAESPVRTGDKIQIVGEIPAEQSAILFSIAPTGVLQILQQYETNRPDTAIQYPANRHQSLPLEGTPGTEIVGLAIGENLPVIRDILERYLSANSFAPLPLITSTFHGRYDSGTPVQAAAPQLAAKPAFEQLAGRTRNIGLPAPTDVNVAAIHLNLSELILDLQKEGIVVEIIAFPHEES